MILVEVNMLKELRLRPFFIQEAAKIVSERKRALEIHPSNIRASGNIVEQAVREFVYDRLPGNFHVGQGHIIDQHRKVSPQLDILVTDVSSLPILLKTHESTDYYPIESVYGFGEIKSTYRKRSKQIKKFCDTIREIRSSMYRIEDRNTAYNGITGDTYLHHMGLGSPNPTLNPLFSFMFFVDGGDFKFEDFKCLLSEYESKHLPNLIILLNKGVVVKGIMRDTGMGIDLYPEYEKQDSKWYFSNLSGSDEFTGINLTVLYFCLLMHLKDCHLRCPDYFKYFSDVVLFSKSRLQE